MKLRIQSKPRPVIIAGAINTDLVARVHRAPEAGETVTGTSFAMFAGGKGGNQAVAVSRSGGAAVMLGAVGDDPFGQARVADLEQDHVDVSRIVTRPDAPSGVALIVVDDRGQNRISYVPGATLTINSDEALSTYLAFPGAIVLATLELPDVTLTDLFAAAKAAGSPVICNATPEPANHRAIPALADILIVNETEALELLPDGEQTNDWEEVARRLAQLGPRTVAITLGAQGALVLADRQVTRLAAPPVEVVDTTGAGDAFCGTFAAQLARGSSVEDSARAGVAAGSLAVTKAGAQPSIPTEHQVAASVSASRARS